MIDFVPVLSNCKMNGEMCMLDKKIVEERMRERGFVVYAMIGKTQVNFVSEYMYDSTYIERTPKRERIPVINIVVDLEKDEFKCIYNLDGSLNTLSTPNCGPVLNDKHFDKIVSQFESQSKWMARLTSAK